MEDGENFEAAAVRETSEETGYGVKIVSKLGDYEYSDRGEKVARVFIGKTTGGSLAGSSEGEVLWQPIGEINESNLAFPQEHLRVIENDLKRNE